MNILGYMQKVGKALMVPIAVLPAAGLMLGIGYAIDPAGWGANNVVAAILVQGGAGLMDMQGWLFAIGVAYGLSKDQNGAAALAGLVAMLILKQLLTNQAAISGIPMDALAPEAASAFAKGQLNGAFMGILSGIVAATLYNRFHNIQLPAAFAFFGGRRFVPIITGAVMLVVGTLLIFIWPPICSALTNFGKSFIDLGPAGAALYGFFNRLLIPTGLHHMLNNVFWFGTAGINDIGNFWANTGVKGVTGMYMAGFFPIMGYGLPAACLAMYHCAKPENKKRVGSIMMAGGLTAFVTGVTEPIEFAFMFVAPVLYVIHAALTALSLYLAASFQFIAGFNFSGGMIDFLLSMNLPLANKPFMLVLQGLVFGAIYYSVFRFAIIKFDLKTPGREDVADEASASESAGSGDKAPLYLKALGGHANLVVIDSCITRLRLTLKDPSIVDENALKALGAAGVIKVGEKNLQVVVGTEAELIASAMKQIPASQNLDAVELPST